MEQGPHEELILKQAARSGAKLPDAIQNAPELQPGLGIFMEGYLELSSSRQVGMGPGQIPWKAVMEYCMFYELDEELTEDMQHHVRQMDVVWLEHHRKKES